MKMKILAVSFLVMLCASHVASAASLSAVRTGDVYSIYLDGGSENGDFNVVGLEISPLGLATFHNIETGYNGFTPRLAGEPLTFFNRYLNIDPSLGGLGWNLFGVHSVNPVVSPTLIEVAGGPLGKQIDTSLQPGGKLFLANVVLPDGMARADIQLVDNGVSQYLPALVFGVPEPAGATIVAVASVAIVGARRARTKVVPHA